MNTIIPTTNKTKKTSLWLIISIIVLIVAILCGLIFLILSQSSSAWKTYISANYLIKYPVNMQYKEIGDNNNKRVILTSQDFDVEISTGLVKGYKVEIFTDKFESLETLFQCNQDPSFLSCILNRGPLQIIDYTNGQITKTETEINNWPAVKYNFISNNGKNNNTGLIVKMEDSYQVVAITYKEKKQQIFDQIIASFHFLPE